MFRYNCLLIDLDGTLLNFDQAEHAALVETLKHFSIPATDDVLTRYKRINKALWKSFEMGEITKEKLVKVRFSMLLSQLNATGNAVEMNSFYLNELSKCGYPYEGVFELLEQLEDGCTIAVATNGVQKTQEGRVVAGGIAPYVDELITSEAAGAAKPSAKFFSHALRLLGVTNKTKTIMVGDNLLADIKGGQQFGIDTCWYNPEGLPNETDVTPTYTISNYDELVRIVMGEDEYFGNQKNRS